ncbi:MAG: hypothetical protein EOO63_18165 [Hymenobacter sp.]|nr:MAG: hypothetical protein EOO63_18165 [Hymenobacter sp.]
MKILCFVLLLLTGGAANAQRIAAKKGLITVDGQPYARFESDGASTLYISSLQNERLFVVKEMVLPNLVVAGVGHSSGNVRYLQYVFTASHTVVETPFPSTEVYFRSITPARQIYAARLFQNGTLDPKAVADFVTNNGTPFSDRQRQLAPLPATSTE